MQNILRNSVIFLILIKLFTLNSFAASSVANPSLAPMLEKVLPAVVNIRAQIKITDLATLIQLQREKKLNSQDVPDKFLSVGSGVIVDAKKGYILTNAHVVNDAQSVTVTLGDGRHYNAKIIGLDKPSDIGLLQIQAKNLVDIPISDSNNLKVGDYVAAIGNPFGLSQSVTSGIISALGRTTLGIESLENFIQTDAPINPGNSGGALINIQGELVGINTAILGPNRGSVGIGFAIPANMANSVMLQLLEFGNVKRGALGVGVQDVSPELATAFNLNISKGAAVTLVMANSPAAQAGIQVGDIITRINGNEITSANSVVNNIAFLRVDSKAKIEILRNNKAMDLSIILFAPQKSKITSEIQDPFLYGMGLKNFSITSPIHGDVKGVLIVSIEEDSNAWHADLQAGDVIVSANQQKVNDIAELRKIASTAKQSLLVNILRGPSAVFLIINKEEPSQPQA